MEHLSFFDPRFIADYIYEDSELPGVLDRLIDESGDAEDQKNSIESTDTTEFTGNNDTVNTNTSELTTSGTSNKQRKLSSWFKSTKQASLPKAGSFTEKVKKN